MTTEKINVRFDPLDAAFEPTTVGGVRLVRRLQHRLRPAAPAGKGRDA